MVANLLTASGPHPVFGDPRKNWGWLLGFGVVSTILGAIGLGMTFTLSVVSALVFGGLLAAAGGIQLVDAFKCPGWKGILSHLLIGLVYLGAGVIMIFDPLSAAVALALVLGSALIVIGGLRVVSGFQHRSERGWQWAVGAGVLSLLLGVLVLAGWPVTGVWVLGLIVAVELLINGWTYLFFGLAARKAAQRGDGQGGGAAP